MERLIGLALDQEWPGEVLEFDAPYFDFNGNGVPTFILFLEDPDEKEIQGARKGTLDLAIYSRGPVMFMCLKIKGMGGAWMDAPFSIRKHDNVGNTIDWSEQLDEDHGMAFDIFLVDRRTKKIKAIRTIGANRRFSCVFRDEIMKQLTLPYSDTAYNQIIQEVYQHMSSNDIAVRASAMYRAGTR